MIVRLIEDICMSALIMHIRFLALIDSPGDVDLLGVLDEGVEQTLTMADSPPFWQIPDIFNLLNCRVPPYLKTPQMGFFLLYEKPGERQAEDHLLQNSIVENLFGLYLSGHTGCGDLHHLPQCLQLLIDVLGLGFRILYNSSGSNEMLILVPVPKSLMECDRGVIMGGSGAGRGLLNIRKESGASRQFGLNVEQEDGQHFSLHLHNLLDCLGREEVAGEESEDELDHFFCSFGGTPLLCCSLLL